MAQVRFYQMQIRFQKLKDLLDTYGEPDFATLIFQSVNADAQGNQDHYDLNAFVAKSDRSINFEITDPNDLKRDPNDYFHKKNASKIVLANYHLSRATIIAYRDGAGGNLIKWLSLKPKDYPSDDRYESYDIIPKNTESAEVDVDLDEGLNPSPPADPQ